MINTAVNLVQNPQFAGIFKNLMIETDSDYPYAHLPISSDEFAGWQTPERREGNLHDSDLQAMLRQVKDGIICKMNGVVSEFEAIRSGKNNVTYKTFLDTTLTTQAEDKLLLAENDTAMKEFLDKKGVKYDYTA